MSSSASQLVIIAAVCALGCGRAPAGDSAPRAPRFAELRVALEAELSIERVTYTLSRPDGYRSSGAIPLSGDGTAFSGVLLLPVGVGYRLDAQAVTRDGSMCHGSARFDIKADRTTPLQLHLICPVPDAGARDAGRDPNTPDLDAAIENDPNAGRDAGRALDGGGDALDEDAGVPDPSEIDAGVS